MPKKLTANERGEIIDQLIGNEGCCDERDREYLEEMTDNSLIRLLGSIEDRAVVNAVAHALGAPQGVTANQLADYIVANAEEGAVPKGDDADEWGDDESENDGPETDEEEEPSDDGSGGADGIKANRRMSMQDWMRIAPPEVRSAVNNARKIELQQKGQLIERIVANLSGEQREITINLLRTKSNEELEVLANLAPAQAPQSMELWTGAATPIGNANGSKPEPMSDAHEEFAVANSNGRRKRSPQPMEDYED